MIKNIHALDNRTIPISPGRGKSAPFVSRFIFHKQMNIIHIQIISNNCKSKHNIRIQIRTFLHCSCCHFKYHTVKTINLSQPQADFLGVPW